MLDVRTKKVYSNRLAIKPCAVLGVLEILIMLTNEEQIFKQIEKSEHILISFPMDWNGDAVASALSFYLLLKKMGKDVEVIAQKIEGFSTDVNSIKSFSFLPSFSDIKDSLKNLRKFIVSIDISKAKINQIKYTVENNVLNFIISPEYGWFTHEDISSSSSGFKYDLIIVLDTPDLESLGNIYDNHIEFFYKTSIINIDYHSSNEEFGQINFIDLNAVSTSEILYYLFKNHQNDLIDENIATCLLAGIIHKTKNFKTANLTPHTLLTTSKLISLGARREEIVHKLYRSRSFSALKLWGRVLEKMRQENSGKIIWSLLDKQDFKDTNSTEEDLNDIVDELIINLPQAKVIVIFIGQTNIDQTETNEPNNTKIKIYSLKNINLLDVLKEYQPLGTQKLAQINLAKNLQTSEEEIITKLKAKLDKITE